MSARIGPAGILARVCVGLGLIAVAVFWWDPEWQDPAIGLVLMPAVVTGLASLRAHRAPHPFHATGPVGHALNVAVFVPLFWLPATAGAAALFYGASMLVAAGRRTGGCEVTAVSNALLGRDDQVGCVVFAPVDLLEATARRTSRAAVRGS